MMLPSLGWALAVLRLWLLDFVGTLALGDVRGTRGRLTQQQSVSAGERQLVSSPNS